MKDSEVTSETTTVVTYPIVGAIYAVEEFLKKKGHVTGWEHQNETQRKFLEKFLATCKKEIPMIPEIEYIAHLDVEIINDWLKHHGFSIQLTPTPTPGFSVASKLDLSDYWNTMASVTEIITDDSENYPGIKMKGSYRFFQAKGIDNLIVQVDTETDTEVYLVMMNEVPVGFALVEFVLDIQSMMEPAMIEFTDLRFPMIDLNQEGPLDWILRMRVNVDNPSVPYHEIGQALQQTMLKMNEKGFRIKSAAAMQMVLGAPLDRRNEPYIIDKPFLMWVRKPTLSKPLFVGYFNRDVWKNPSGLEM